MDVVLYDVARAALRRRLEGVLRARGFTRLFPNAMWGERNNPDRSGLERAIRSRLRGEAYGVLLLRITPHQQEEAIWLLGAGRREP